MRYWLDTEFNEDGETIKLISIGVVAEDGREYYAEVKHAKTLCYSSIWLTKNVLPGLTGVEKSRAEIATDLVEFMPPDMDTQIWAYWGAYDWVALCQLYGRMVDLPGWPYFLDLYGVAKSMDYGKSDLPPQREGHHNALADARWNKEIWEFLRAAKQLETESKKLFI